MQIAPVSAAQQSDPAFGLDFQALLKIILTQLTYQDPLKPMDNFQFVSQLAQFTQIQQSESINTQLTNLLSAQAATQATTLLGRTIDFTSGQSQLSGVVKAVSFQSGQPEVSIETSTGQIIPNIPIANIGTVR
jgi:flagellar basal-body rod modification protein FlgD